MKVHEKRKMWPWVKEEYKRMNQWSHDEVVRRVREAAGKVDAATTHGGFSGEASSRFLEDVRRSEAQAEELRAQVDKQQREFAEQV